MKRLFAKLLDREMKHPVLAYPFFLYRVAACKKRYARILARLHTARQFKVVFLSAGPAKWKCQSVHDEMVRSGMFEPIVLCMDGERSFYEGMGCKCTNESPCDLNIDIAIYQDPWSPLAEKYPVWQVSRNALCCYIPYSIESISQGNRSERFDYHHLADFHSLMFACFQWSESYARHYRQVQFPWEWAGSVLGFGHPSLDLYNSKGGLAGEYVIYAPHFSFEYNGIMPISSIGTFPWSGRAVLEYAKAHPEQKWLFKPHPKLRSRLVEIGFMTEAEVDLYYKEWEKTGAVCYDGNYARWFMGSKAMVTDSNSFLLEYMAVGKPLLHLVPQKTNMKACAEAESVFKTFYAARDVEEMTAWLKTVVEDGQDPRGDERRDAARSAAVLDNHAGKRIVDWLLALKGGSEACL